MAHARIMVVEDEGIVALDIQSKLEVRGYEVPAVVSTGEDAVEQAGLTRPDLVLMDIQLKGEMDGIAAAEQIRTRYAIPVVYLTAFSDDSTLERAKIAEPFGYVLKPFEERKLHTTVEIALYKHGVEKEKERLEAQLHQARKMEAIGRLTAGIAYNFTNMLQGIQGNLELALAAAPDELKPPLESADYDVQRAGQLIRQLMLFYQREQGKREQLDMGQIAREVMETCRQIFSRKHTRTVHIGVTCVDDLPSARGDEPQIRQCLAALCQRAGDALEAGDTAHPRVQINLSIQQIDSETGPAGAQTSGRHLRIDVVDNGAPIDQQTRERLFEPFLSTQDPSQSTGLGLATAYAIVREHQGWVECTSAAGSDTTLSLFLPAASGQEASSTGAPVSGPTLLELDDASQNPESLRGDEKILVIADVDRYRKIHAEILELHGYDVLVGLDVSDALNILQFERDEVAAVVVDLSTASLSRQELMSQVRHIDPSVKVLAVTGYSTDTGPWEGATAVLDKPYRLLQFLRAVRQVIDA